MTEGIKNIGNISSHTYRSQSAESQRAMAVAAALDLIALNVSGAHSGGLLESELKSLGDYADKIQEALKSK
ncbi:hypothetical protein GIW54_09810 [Pseudomonas proteolytica]|uniref:DUF3077 domain-containing protein n=1 Tax=Pseudomonas proteolytica TaxID=219574 RepID=A0AAW5AB54_9PSED|nr:MULTISPECIES: hypothetical protein [Pseudomonas]AQT94277.1 hypothetical protein B1R45_13695 [Pseudomonas azotoformans]MBD9585815.1 hypothetical protein [Pseudomonas sp. PDM03]MCF5059082.1 hypothetical protein [Pseudomonas proteolytica]MCF5101062.1 hypothetical protein [Pseudomonas proteolytica]UMY52054.1 hypothetical protein MLC69_13640 [Pseudomonas azotoformans]